MKSLYQLDWKQHPLHLSKKVFFFLFAAGTLVTSSYILLKEQGTSPNAASGAFYFPDEAPDFNIYITKLDARHLDVTIVTSDFNNKITI